jgi:hypothetical protein
LPRFAEVSTPITQGAAAVFFYARAVLAVIHISGFSLLMARTVVFTVSWLAFMAFAIELLRHVA